MSIEFNPNKSKSAGEDRNQRIPNHQRDGEMTGIPQEKKPKLKENAELPEIIEYLKSYGFTQEQADSLSYKADEIINCIDFGEGEVEDFIQDSSLYMKERIFTYQAAILHNAYSWQDMRSETSRKAGDLVQKIKEEIDSNTGKIEYKKFLRMI